MKELVVVAIGGNSIIKDNASQSIEHQAEAVKCNQVNHLIPTRVLVKGGEITCKILK
ncbi:carbamate kinase [Escherichia coli]|nr:carbamate kinase [Escherichia coli]